MVEWMVQEKNNEKLKYSELQIEHSAREYTIYW